MAHVSALHLWQNLGDPDALPELPHTWVPMGSILF